MGAQRNGLCQQIRLLSKSVAPSGIIRIPQEPGDPVPALPLQDLMANLPGLLVVGQDRDDPLSQVQSRIKTPLFPGLRHILFQRCYLFGPQ